MPLYEYECTTCHKRTEKIQKFSDPELTVCPHCNGKLERTITAAAFSFAGGGWYKDGYGSAKPPAAGASDGKGSGDAVPAASSGDSGAPAAPAAAASTPAPSAPAASAPASAPAASTAAKS